MAGFNPSEPRVPSGGPAGGQWGNSAPSRARKSAAPANKAVPAKPASGKAPKLGRPRNAAAAKIQQDKQAQQLYHDMLGKSPGEQAAYAKSLSPDQLEKLTGILYSSPTSDPAIVRARVVVANEMNKRGLDIRKYGAQGGGPASPARKVSPAQHAAVAVARAKAAAKSAPASAPVVAPRLPTTGFKNRAV